MGVVFRAWDSLLKIEVALKTLPPAPADPSLAERFDREFRALARLGHPHVVRITDAGRQDGRPYFATRWMPGGSLDRQLARFAEPKAAAALVGKVAQAMHYVHGNGVLHRDLKPANILLDDAGEPCVTDFGLAKFRDGGLDLTNPGAVLGTVPYMAPEQASGRLDRLGPATDVWALGVILYELLTGRRPFRVKRAEAAASEICTSEPPRPRSLRPEIDRSLEVVVLKCLEKRPEDRYASAAELADDLARWQAGEPIRAEPPPLRTRLARWVRRHATAVTAAALVAVALLAVPLLSAAWIRAAERARVEDRQRLITEDLRQVRQELDRGRAAPLTPLRVPPESYNRRIGRPELVQLAGEPPAVRLSNFRTGALDLLPGSPRESYRFSAEVRISQVIAEDINCGLYVAAREWPGADRGTEQWFVSLAFPDKASAPVVTFELHRYVGQPGGDDNECVRRFVDHALPPGEGAETWRRLRLDVSPSGIVPWWEGEPIPRARIGLADLERALMHSAGRRPSLAAWPSAEEMLRGGLGLYNKNSDTEFRNVTVEPLP
jgi:serine/threonine-protein kinase